jgi:hypothetical protein
VSTNEELTCTISSNKGSHSDELVSPGKAKRRQKVGEMTAREIKGLVLNPLYDKGSKKPEAIKFTEIYEFCEFLGKGGFG